MIDRLVKEMSVKPLTFSCKNCYTGHIQVDFTEGDEGDDKYNNNEWFVLDLESAKKLMGDLKEAIQRIEAKDSPH